MQDSNRFVRAALRAAIAEKLRVDEATGTISGAAVMQIGPARGHGFSIDATTLEQVCDLINSAFDGAGVKCRFKHPAHDDETGSIADDLGDVIGRVKNARVDGDTLRADVELGDYAANLPGLGDVKSYLLKRAKSDPTGFGLSAVLVFEPEPVFDGFGGVETVVARAVDLLAVDCVGRGAATPNGLLAVGADEAVFLAETKRVDLIRGLGAALEIDESTILAAIASGEEIAATQVRFVDYMMRASVPQSSL